MRFPCPAARITAWVTLPGIMTSLGNSYRAAPRTTAGWPRSCSEQFGKRTQANGKEKYYVAFIYYRKEGRFVKRHGSE